MYAPHRRPPPVCAPTAAQGSATRVELRKLYGQGSLPHVFIGGEWVGGLATGADGGLAGLVEREELAGKLRAARAV